MMTESLGEFALRQSILRHGLCRDTSFSKEVLAACGGSLRSYYKNFRQFSLPENFYSLKPK